MSRCFGDGHDLSAAYHDREWGRPVRDEARLFELLTLEAFQSGLSWRLVLERREALRSAFTGFDPDTLARLADDDVDRLLAAPGMIRHRGKIAATIANARATVDLRGEVDGGLVALVWSFAPTGERSAPVRWEDVPDRTGESAALAKALRRRGFRFVGPTTAYSLMQAAGVVNDHLAGCPVREEAAAAVGPLV